MAKEPTPFHCGMQAEAWFVANCDRCTKKENCDITVTLQRAGLLGDGRIDQQTATRMGYLDPTGKRTRDYCWPCNEVEWTEEWKAEVLRRRGEVA